MQNYFNFNLIDFLKYFFNSINKFINLLTTTTMARINQQWKEGREKKKIINFVVMVT